MKDDMENAVTARFKDPRIEVEHAGVGPQAGWTVTYKRLGLREVLELADLMNNRRKEE